MHIAFTVRIAPAICHACGSGLVLLFVTLQFAAAEV
jgi:hypothetical protein